MIRNNTRVVAEYAPDGIVVWEMKMPFTPFGVQRLKSGHTLVSGRDGIIEVTPKKEIVWRLTREDVKAVGPRWFAGFRIRPSGNIVVCNPGGTVPVYEVNRRKEVVWKTSLTKEQVGMAHGLFLLSEKSDDDQDGRDTAPGSWVDWGVGIRDWMDHGRGVIPVASCPRTSRPVPLISISFRWKPGCR